MASEWTLDQTAAKMLTPTHLKYNKVLLKKHMAVQHLPLENKTLK